MKKVFVTYVMIFSLLLAVCGCSSDLSPQQETDLESPQVQGSDEQSTQEPDIEPDIEQEETDDSTDEQEENEPVPHDIETPEVDPPIVEPIEVKPPEIIPPEIKPPAVEPIEVKPPEIIPPEIKPPAVEPIEVVPPEINSPVINLLEINELRTEFSSAAKRAEYIEFKVKQDGNLNGLRLLIMYDAKSPFIYNFPAVDVSLGEYITLHLRTLESTCIDELEDDLSLSGGTDSCPTARDLWVSGSAKLLHKTDIIYLQDKDGRVLDAIIMNQAPGTAWSKNQAHFAEILENLFYAGMWKAEDGQMPNPYDAVDTSTIKSSATKSVSRYEEKESTHTANDWYITAAGGASPGKPNN